jgi:hypothetical protein
MMQRNRDTIITLALLTGPLVWMLSFAVGVAFSGWTCSSRSKLPLYVASAMSLLLTGWAMIAAWRQWLAAGKGVPGETAGELARTRALAIGGIGLNGLFLIVAIGQTIPQLLLGGCE